MTNDDEEAMQHISAMARNVPGANEAFAQWVKQGADRVEAFLAMSATLAEFLKSHGYSPELATLRRQSRPGFLR